MTAGPISPADVRAGVARELRALAGLGVAGAEAQRRAVEVTAAKIRNAPALGERQGHPGKCHACGEALDDFRPVVGVLGAVLVDGIIRAAGYGATAEGEAA